LTDSPEDQLVPEFPDVPAFVEVLNRQDVRYVIIGGYAAQGFVSGYVTYDVDFTPATDMDNLERLSLALTELGARIRAEAVEEGLPFAHDGESLGRAKTWNLQCRHGALISPLSLPEAATSTWPPRRTWSPSTRWTYPLLIWPMSLPPRGWPIAERTRWSSLG
jgi:hypothetical protein